MGNVVGKAKDYLAKFKFTVECAAFGRAGFSTCSEIAMEVGEMQIREGGALLPHKQPGLGTVPDVTLERGATNDVDLLEWFQRVADYIRADTAGVPSSAATAPDFFKVDITVWQRDRSGLKQHGWKLHNAWPKRFSAGDFDADAEEFRVESLVLVYDYPERIPAST